MYGAKNRLLGGVRRNSQRRSNLFSGAIFHVPQHKRGLFRCRQALHRGLLQRTDLAAQQQPVRTSRTIRHLHGILLRIVLFAYPAALIHLAPAHSVQSAAHRNPVNPRAEIRPRLKPFQLLISPQKSFLHHVLRIRLVAGNAKCDPEEAMAMAHHQSPIRLLVP